MKPIKVLVCTDSPCVQTGYGRVVSELFVYRMSKLKNSDGSRKYEFHFMGTNDVGEPHEFRGLQDQGIFIYPLTDLQNDPYGIHRMPELLNRVQPDLVFSLNDIWVWTGDEKRRGMDHWFYKHLKNYKPFVPWVGYFAVDGRPWEQRWVECANMMTRAVVFSDYGEKVLNETPGVDLSKVRKIYHGAAVDKFYPLPKEEIIEFRKEIGVPEDSFVVGAVNRNQPRKNIPRLIQVFKMFSDGYGICAGKDEDGNICGHPRNPETLPDCEICGETEFSSVVPGVGTQNTALYLHMNPLDMRGFRLPKVFSDNQIRNVVFPQDHHVALGVPVEELNKIYNMMDVHVSTTYAGGWELTTPESQAAGTPNIGTRSTCMTEHLDNGKGFPVWPESPVVLDDANHCLKHPISVKRLLATLEKVYYDRDLLESVIEPGRKYALSRDWDQPAKDFDKVFEEAIAERIELSTCFEKSENRKLMLVNKSTDPANTLSMIPLLRGIKEQNKEMEIVLASNSPELVENNKLIDKVIDPDKIWNDEKEIKNLNVQDVTSLIPNFINQAAKFSNKTWEEVWCESFRIEPSNTDLEIHFNKDDKKFARDNIKNSNKIKLAICVDASNPTLALPLTKWKEIADLFAKFDEIDTYLFNTREFDTEATIIETGDIRKIAACVDKCDLVLTLDNSFTLISKALKKRIYIIQGPRDCSYKMGDYKNYEIISKKELFKECLPCWIGPGQRCMVSGNDHAACLANINASEVFGKIMKYILEREDVPVG